jgi:YHS domain-containing protein
VSLRKRLEALYRRDGRPLPDYMRKDGSNGAPQYTMPSPDPQTIPPGSTGGAGKSYSAWPAGPAATEGLPRTQRFNNRTAPTPYQQNVSVNDNDALHAPPRKERWIDRINPFHRQSPKNADPSGPKAAPASPNSNASLPSWQQYPATGRPTPPRQNWTTPNLYTPPSANDVRRSPNANGPNSAWNRPPMPPLAPPAIEVQETPPLMAAPETGGSRVPFDVGLSPPKAPPAVEAMPSASSRKPSTTTDESVAPFKELPEQDKEKVEEPYTGLKLDDESGSTSQKDHPKGLGQTSEPAGHVALPNPAPAAPAPQETAARPANPPRPQTPQLASSSASLPMNSPSRSAVAAANQPSSLPGDDDMSRKLRKIQERAGQTGLKGFCPVTLRDQRDLVDARPSFHSIYESKTYYFASAEAKAFFDRSPAKYAPVAAGIDIVVKANSDQLVEGTLDHAAWYKDRLYLFTSPESLEAFSLNPQRYSALIAQAR